MPAAPMGEEAKGSFFLGHLALWNPLFCLLPSLPMLQVLSAPTASLDCPKLSFLIRVGTSNNAHIDFCSRVVLPSMSIMCPFWGRPQCSVWWYQSNSHQGLKEIEGRAEVGNLHLPGSDHHYCFKTWFLCGYLIWRSFCDVQLFTAGFKKAMDTDGDRADA